MAAFNEITPAQLMRLIGTPACLVLVGVCIDSDFADDPYLIPTAKRYACNDINGLAHDLNRRGTVVICQKGKKLSHEVAAQLRAAGINAQVLQGGNHAWREAQLPRVPAEVVAVADRFGATPFDIEDGYWGRRGDQCTFDTMIGAFGLSHPALNALATVMRAADTDRHDLAPQAAGLLAISVGLSRLYRDDTRQLNAGMGIYDALYRWARDGQDETHDG